MVERVESAERRETVVTGAILRREIVVPGRKLLTFLVRGGYAFFLAAMFAIVFLIHLANLASGGGGASIRAVADTAQNLVSTLVTINLMACLLFTPAYVAGAIAQEKDQRTMQDLLLTTMSSVEIVLSKLFGRLAQVLLVLATGMPLVAIGSLLGGVSGSMMLAIAAMTVLWLVTAGSFTLLISVLVRRTRDAILGSYALGTILLVGMFTASYFIPAHLIWLQDIVASFNPFTILRPAWSGAAAGEVWRLIGKAGLVLGVFSGGAVGLTFFLLRPLGVAQLEVKTPRGWRLRRRAYNTPGEEPMLWKEKCFPPSGRMTRLLHYLGLLVTLGIAVLIGISYWMWISEGRRQSAMLEAGIWMFVPGLVAWPLYLSMLLTTSSAFSGERERATWDAILTSSLGAREIVTGKLWGSVWEVRWWLAALALCFAQGLVSAIIASESIFLMMSGMSQNDDWSLGRALLGVLVVFTGSLFGGRGIVGLAGQILFLLGVGLRTSLGCRTSGKSLGLTLLIWFGSGIVFKVVAYIGFVAFMLLFSRFGIAGGPSWFGTTRQVIGAQFVWFGPLASGLLWCGVGWWLIRRTIREFDLLANRMPGAEVKMLPGVDAPETGLISTSADLATTASENSTNC
jgi:ABC-type transport system involved in multi-copper enzyme maturation permease subunit